MNARITFLGTGTSSGVPSIGCTCAVCLSADQHENYNLWTFQGMTMGWVFIPMLEIMGAYDKSVQEYPNIKPGEDFKGYPRKK